MHKALSTALKNYEGITEGIIIHVLVIKQCELRVKRTNNYVNRSVITQKNKLFL